MVPQHRKICRNRLFGGFDARLDLTELFIGAEGTLRVVTEGVSHQESEGNFIPNRHLFMLIDGGTCPLLKEGVPVVQLPSVRNTAEAVHVILNIGIGIRMYSLYSSHFCIELLDDKVMGVINTYGQSIRKWPEKDSLFIKFQGPSVSSIFEFVKLVSDSTAAWGDKV